MRRRQSNTPFIARTSRTDMPWAREARVTQLSICRKTQDRRWKLAWVCVNDIWTKLLRCGVDGTLTGADESEIQEQQRSPKNAISLRELNETRNLLGLAGIPQTVTAQRRTIVHIGRRLGSGLVQEERSKKGSCRRRTLLSPLERRVASMRKVATKFITRSTRQ
jgi:hypothetical protein